MTEAQPEPAARPEPRVVREVAADALPALVHPEWAQAFRWLVQGTTRRGPEGRPFDLGLFSGGLDEEVVREGWSRLAEETGADRVVHAHQVHGARVRLWGEWNGASEWDGARGGAESVDPPILVEPCDGHATGEPGVLLAVTTADCVPVFVVDPGGRAVAMLHAGWRGAAAGILEEGLSTMLRALGSEMADLHVHLGPAICGSCYEVGPEVFEALGRPVPAAPTPIDLRSILAERAVEAGVERERITVSAHCTRCTGSGLFSHRGGDAHRHVGYLGIRAPSDTQAVDGGVVG